jgi:hypothetical protein
MLAGLAPSRRGGRAVEGARLESVCRFTPTEGSNPSLSATIIHGGRWQLLGEPRERLGAGYRYFKLLAEILRLKFFFGSFVGPYAT